MKYDWSDEQRRGLTFGSTVEVDGERRVFRGFANKFYGTLIFEPDDLRGISTGEIDPSTLRPPSIEWIRELAKEMLGGECSCWDDGEFVVLTFGGKLPDDSQDRCHVSVSDLPSMDRFRAAVAAIVALANAGLGK